MKKIFLFLTLLAFGCSTPASPEKKRSLVLVTIPAYKEIVEIIGMDAIRVESVIPQGANQHLFDPSPRQMAKLEGAVMWFGIDEPIERNILPSLREHNPNFEYINLANLAIPLETSLCGHHDRHIWMDPIEMVRQAGVVYQALLMLVPDKHEEITAGYQKVKATLQLIDREIQNQLAPYKGDAILVSHAAFGYFCRRYNLKQLSIECEGKAPRPKDIERLLEQFSKQKIRCVLVQDQHDEKAGRLFAKKLNVAVYRVDPAGPHYFQMLRALSEDIAR